MNLASVRLQTPPTQAPALPPAGGDGRHVDAGQQRVARQQLRNELDALVAHILGAFPLVFPDDVQGRAKRAALLAVYDKIAASPTATPFPRPRPWRKKPSSCMWRT